MGIKVLYYMASEKLKKRVGYQKITAECNTRVTKLVLSKINQYILPPKYKFQIASTVK
jgi:hypothetical protein